MCAVAVEPIQPGVRLHLVRVLAVDDQEDTRRVLQRALTTMGYEVEVACDGIEALAKLPLGADLVLLDARMPGLDGFEVARRIRSDPEHCDLPIIMVTGLDSREDRLRAVEAGVNDFIAKPFELTELRVRTESLLRLKEATDALKRHRAELEQAVAKRTGDLRSALEGMAAAQRSTYAAHLDTIRRLVIAAEYKDRDTAAHIERIGLYSELIASLLGLAPGDVEVIRHATPMHDVGKIGVPDAVLLKPGKLDADEWEVMKQHTAIGARILHGSPSPVLLAGEVVALAHHERWDGRGYPQGLSENAIPLAGRICAVADVFDALTSNRHYRDALPNPTVWEMIQAEKGRHFDPVVVDVFTSSRETVERIQKQSQGG
ncbi:MAG TPA: HD domain-containing phosphohydrolase [Terriglobales bacterium]|nr:HD domain-containing phosphohydrolase [Terriglobales bacterium]